MSESIPWWTSCRHISESQIVSHGTWPASKYQTYRKGFSLLFLLLLLLDHLLPLLLFLIPERDINTELSQACIMFWYLTDNFWYLTDIPWMSVEWVKDQNMVLTGMSPFLGKPSHHEGILSHRHPTAVLTPVVLSYETLAKHSGTSFQPVPRCSWSHFSLHDSQLCSAHSFSSFVLYFIL